MRALSIQSIDRSPGSLTPNFSIAHPPTILSYHILHSTYQLLKLSGLLPTSFAPLPPMSTPSKWGHCPGYNCMLSPNTACDILEGRKEGKEGRKEGRDI